MIGLTDKQKEVYEFIKHQISSKGFGPSLREIMAKLGYKSPTVVAFHVKALEKKGLIRRQPHMWRSLRLVKETDGDLPELTGRVMAGQLPGVGDTKDYFEFGKIIGKNLSVSQIVGSFDETIKDGDYVFFKYQQSPRDGQFVRVILENGQTIIKRWHSDNERSSNERITGVAVGIFRTLS
jgi:repressor LexA